MRIQNHHNFIKNLSKKWTISTYHAFTWLWYMYLCSHSILGSSLMVLDKYLSLLQLLSSTFIAILCSIHQSKRDSFNRCQIRLGYYVRWYFHQASYGYYRIFIVTWILRSFVYFTSDFIGLYILFHWVSEILFVITSLTDWWRL